MIIYAHDSVNSIPWEFLVGNVIVNEDEHIKFNDRIYYYFSKTPSDFTVDNELSQVIKDGNIIKIYKVKDQTETEWIAVKNESFYKDGYLLYWVRETSLPRQFFDIWRTYGR